MSDVLGWFPAIDWRWFYIGGVVVFAIIMQLRISNVEAKLKPKLMLVFGDDKSCRYHLKGAGDFRPILYRVGLQNIGGVTIDSWKVFLEKFEPQGAEFLPAQLTVMNYPSNDPDIKLHPSDIPSYYIDVIGNSLSFGKKNFVLQYANPNLPNVIDVGRYKLTLLAQGEDVQPERINFIVDLDDSGNMIFQEANDEQESE